MKSKIIYMAVRRSDDGEWADSGTAHYCPDSCASAANRLDGEAPQWAEANPVVRISCFRFEEVIADA